MTPTEENVGEPTMKVTVEDSLNSPDRGATIRRDVSPKNFCLLNFETEFEKHKILHRGSQ
jgi:hypothetical protein